MNVENLNAYEKVFITGSAVSLGEWHWEKLVPMKKIINTNKYSAQVLLSTCDHVQYRYLLAVRDEFGLQIRKIEVQKQPRISVPCKGLKCAQPQDKFGDYKTSTGFLTTETRLQLNFIYSEMFDVLNTWKFQTDNMRIKIVQTIGFHPANRIELTKHYFGHSKYKPQTAKGALYKSGSIISYQLTSHIPTVDCYKLLFYSAQGHRMAEADFCTSQLSRDQGVLELAVYDPVDQQKVANLKLPYLIIQPYFKAHLLNLNSSYAHNVPTGLAPIYVGHRGNGANFKQLPTTNVENTIESYLTAVNAKIDMIELDVQVSKDGIPFIAHDFVALVAKDNSITPSNVDQLQSVTLNSLDYKDIQNIQQYVVSNDQVRKYSSYNEERNPQKRLFSKLRSVLQAVPEHVAFDLDIKTPQTLLDDSEEAQKPEDLNSFVDAILEVVLEFSCSRIIVISCFDANTCTLFAQKQNKIPVLFLTMGYTVRWGSYLYKDERTRTLLNGLNFADSQNMAGLAPSSEEFALRGIDHADNREFFRRAKQLNQITLMWGEECNSQEMIAKFFELGANAVCFDEADKLMSKSKRDYFFKDIVNRDSVCPLPHLVAAHKKLKLFGFMG